jgi:hypothetical protein
MTTLELLSLTAARSTRTDRFDEAQLAVAAFLFRYSGRTLDAYRHDLQVFFQWAADSDWLCSRPHIELYRTTLEARRLAASTIDRRLSTVCGFYRVRSHRRPRCLEPGPVRALSQRPPPEGHGMDRSELGTFLFTAERFDRDHAALAVLLGLNGPPLASRTSDGDPGYGLAST